MTSVTEKLDFKLLINLSSPHNYDQLLFNKVVKTIQWGKIVFSINGAGTTGFPDAKE